MAIIDLSFEGDDEETQAAEPAQLVETPIALEFEGEDPSQEYPDAPGVTGTITADPYSGPEKLLERISQGYKKAASGIGAMAARQELPTTREEMTEGVLPPVGGGLKDWALYNPMGEMLNTVAGMVTKGVVDVADMVHRGDIREDLITANEVIRKEANATLGAPYMQYEGNAGTKFGYDVTENLARMGPAMVIGWATRNPGLTLAVIGGEVGGTTYSDYMEETGSHDKAMAATRFHVFAEVLPETIPVLAFLRKTKAGEGLKRMLEGTVGEGAQELLTSVLQQTYDNTQLESMSLKEAIDGINWGDAAYEGLIGVFVGGILSSPGAAADYYAGKKQGLGPPPPPGPTDLTPDFEVKPLEENVTAIDDALEARPPGADFEPGEVPEAPEVEAGKIQQDMALTDVEQTAQDLQEAVEAQEPEPVVDLEQKAIDDANNAFVLEQLREQFPDATEAELQAAIGVAKPEAKVEPAPTPEPEPAPEPAADLAWAAPEPAEEVTAAPVTPKPVQPQIELPEAEPVITPEAAEPVEAAVPAEPEPEPVTTPEEVPEVQTALEEKHATEAVEPTGEASVTADAYSTAKPEFEGLILSFKPGDERGDETTDHYYGEIAETEDADGMPIDVVLNKDHDPAAETPVFIINQKDFDTGEFRQHKVMAGFDTAEAAEKGYGEMWDKAGFGSIHELTPDEFATWKAEGDTKVEYAPTQPAEEVTAEKLTPEEQKAQDKAERAEDQRIKMTEKVRQARQVEETDDLATFTRKLGGLNVEKQTDIPPGRLKHLNAELKQVGLPSIEQKGDKGLSLAELTEAAWEAGYITENDTQQLIEKLFEAEQKPVYTAKGYEAAAKAEQEAAYNASLAAEAEAWGEYANEELTQVDPETARLMALAGAINHDSMVDIASLDLPEADVQAALQEFIDERESAKIEAAAAEKPAVEAGRPDEAEPEPAEIGPQTPEEWFAAIKKRAKPAKYKGLKAARARSEELHPTYYEDYRDPQLIDAGFTAGYTYAINRGTTKSASPQAGIDMADDIGLTDGYLDGDKVWAPYFSDAHYLGQLAAMGKEDASLIGAPEEVVEEVVEDGVETELEAPAHLQDIEGRIADGESNADLIPAIRDDQGVDSVTSIRNYEQALRDAGWTTFTRGKGEFWRKDGAELFLRSQGSLSSPIVQWEIAPKVTLDSVLEQSREPTEGSVPLAEIELTAEFEGEKITDNAANWLDEIDERLKAMDKMRTCA